MKHPRYPILAMLACVRNASFPQKIIRATLNLLLFARENTYFLQLDSRCHASLPFVSLWLQFLDICLVLLKRHRNCGMPAFSSLSDELSQLPSPKNIFLLTKKI